jgi:hypothetical protein
VSSEAFVAALLRGTSYELLGVVKEGLKAPAYELGWVYLNASWQLEDKRPRYRVAARAAIQWFDKAAQAMKNNKKRATEYQLSMYITVELARRCGAFDEARRRLKSAQEFTPTGDNPWMASALKFQEALIQENSLLPHVMGENERL